MSRLSETMAAVERDRCDYIAMGYREMYVRLPDVERLLAAAKALEQARAVLTNPGLYECDQIEQAVKLIDKLEGGA